MLGHQAFQKRRRLGDEGEIELDCGDWLSRQPPRQRLQASGIPVEGEDTQAERLLGVWTSEDGAEVALEGDTGVLVNVSGDMRVEGDVVVTDSQGYQLFSDALNIAGDTKDIVSPGPVSGSGPGLALEAGGMRVEQRGGAPLVTFTEGVRVVYDTQPVEGN